MKLEYQRDGTYVVSEMPNFPDLEMFMLYHGCVRIQDRMSWSCPANRKEELERAYRLKLSQHGVSPPGVRSVVMYDQSQQQVPARARKTSSVQIYDIQGIKIDLGTSKKDTDWINPYTGLKIESVRVVHADPRVLGNWIGKRSRSDSLELVLPIDSPIPETLMDKLFQDIVAESGRNYRTIPALCKTFTGPLAGIDGFVWPMSRDRFYNVVYSVVSGGRITSCYVMDYKVGGKYCRSAIERDQMIRETMKAVSLEMFQIEEFFCDMASVSDSDMRAINSLYDLLEMKVSPDKYNRAKIIDSLSLAVPRAPPAPRVGPPATRTQDEQTLLDLLDSFISSPDVTEPEKVVARHARGKFEKTPSPLTPYETCYSLIEGELRTNYAGPDPISIKNLLSYIREISGARAPAIEAKPVAPATPAPPATPVIEAKPAPPATVRTGSKQRLLDLVNSYKLKALPHEWEAFSKLVPLIEQKINECESDAIMYRECASLVVHAANTWKWSLIPDTFFDLHYAILGLPARTAVPERHVGDVAERVLGSIHALSESCTSPQQTYRVGEVETAIRTEMSKPNFPSDPAQVYGLCASIVLDMVRDWNTEFDLIKDFYRYLYGESKQHVPSVADSVDMEVIDYEKYENERKNLNSEIFVIEDYINECKYAATPYRMVSSTIVDIICERIARQADRKIIVMKAHARKLPADIDLADSEIIWPLHHSNHFVAVYIRITRELIECKVLDSISDYNTVQRDSLIRAAVGAVDKRQFIIENYLDPMISANDCSLITIKAFYIILGFRVTPDLYDRSKIFTDEILRITTERLEPAKRNLAHVESILSKRSELARSESVVYHDSYDVDYHFDAGSYADPFVPPGSVSGHSSGQIRIHAEDLAGPSIAPATATWEGLPITFETTVTANLDDGRRGSPGAYGHLSIACNLCHMIGHSMHNCPTRR